MCRVLAVLLLSVLLLGAVAIAEQATQPTAEPTDTEAQTDVGGASLEGDVSVEENTTAETGVWPPSFKKNTPESSA